MFKNLFPKDFNFFENFDKQADIYVEKSEHFKKSWRTARLPKKPGKKCAK